MSLETALLTVFLYNSTGESLLQAEQKSGVFEFGSVAGESRSSFPPFSTVYFQMVPKITWIKAYISRIF